MNEDQRFQLYSQIIGGGVMLLRLIIIAGAIILVMMFTRDILVAFAGQQTNANVVVKFLWAIRADRWLAYIFGVGGIAYGLQQRRLRRRNIERLADDKAAVENRLDPNRSSSGLTKTGRTRPEDRLQ